MKRIIYAAMCVVLAACSNGKCVIDGNIPGLDKEGWVYLQDEWNDWQIIDSVKAVDGVFRFEIDDPKPTHAYLYFNNRIQLHNILIEPGTISVTGNAESAWSQTGTGTPMNDRFMAFVDKLGTIDPTEYSSEEYMDKMADIVRDELRTGNGDAFRLNMIENFMDGNMHPVELLGYFETLDESLQSMEYAEEVKNQIIKMAKVVPQYEGSDIIPYYIDMTYPDTDGKMISLKSVIENPKNRYVLLDFWATWCEPCRESMPALMAAYDKYHELGLEVYAVSCDPKEDNWKQFIKDEGIKWVNVRSGAFRDMPECETYVLQGIPTNILIDCRTGIITHRNIPSRMFDTTFAQLLQ